MVGGQGGMGQVELAARVSVVSGRVMKAESLRRAARRGVQGGVRRARETCKEDSDFF